MKYSQDRKAEALARISEIGVMKTSEEMHISVQTLYKWRNEAGSPEALPEQTNTVAEELKQTIINDCFLEKKVATLEDENAALREENKELRKKTEQLRRAIITLLS